MVCGKKLAQYIRVNTGYRDGSSQIQAMSIRVDGEVWFCTNPKMYNIMYPVSWGGPGSLTVEEAIKKSGYVDNTDTGVGYDKALKTLSDMRKSIRKVERIS